jgi:hypothetical protein
VLIDALAGQVRTAKQAQQLLVELRMVVLVEQGARRQVAQPDRRVAKPGGQQHVRGHAGGEQPGRHLVVERPRGVQAPEPVDDPPFGVLAPPTHP